MKEHCYVLAKLCCLDRGIGRDVGTWSKLGQSKSLLRLLIHSGKTGRNSSLTATLGDMSTDLASFYVSSCVSRNYSESVRRTLRQRWESEKEGRGKGETKRQLSCVGDTLNVYLAHLRLDLLWYFQLLVTWDISLPYLCLRKWTLILVSHQEMDPIF